MDDPRPRLSFREELPYLLACCAAFFLCIAIARPFANSSFVDDWSYAFVALKLAQTGHFHYSGWGSPSIILQCVWAAIWIHLVGFSFNLLRVISLPFSLAFVLLTYVLGRRIGLSRKFALFGSAIVATSPLFVPLACSFMTEPYACSLTLLCIYAAVCCAEAPDSAKAVRWLWIFTVAAILGGSDRQTVWAAPLSLIPYLFWIRRSDRGFRIRALLAYAVCLVAIAVAWKYFSPSYAPTALSHRQLLSLLLTESFGSLRRIASVVLVAVWLSLPAFLCSVPLWKRVTARQTAAILLISAGFFGLLMIGSKGIAPFLGNILTVFGILSAGTDGMGFRPVLLNKPVQYGLTVMLVLVVAAWAYLIWRRNLLMGLSRRSGTVFLLFLCSYLPLLFPGGLTNFLFDRYALPFFPLFAICVLLSVQPLVKKISIVAYVWLFVGASYAVVTTHDYFATLRARAAAAGQLEKYGVAPSQISAGFEHDGWLELQLAGKVGTLMYGGGPEKQEYWFWYFTRATRQDYVAVSFRLSDHQQNAILQIPYTTWTYPFHRKIVMVRLKDIPQMAIPYYAPIPNASHRDSS